MPICTPHSLLESHDSYKQRGISGVQIFLLFLVPASAFLEYELALAPFAIRRLYGLGGLIVEDLRLKLKKLNQLMQILVLHLSKQFSTFQT
tara:strand:+ start:46 stop:318 length:273 start_codon:yes stop_codon:yes gene_type:complete